MTDDNYYLGPPPLYGLGFRSQGRINFYSQSLYWLVHYAGVVQVVTEVMKDGEPLIFGELTYDEVNRLVAEDRLRGLRRHAWGVSWPFKGQRVGAADDFSRFPAWRDQMLAGVVGFAGQAAEASTRLA